MSAQLKIDEEFRNDLVPLKADEREELERLLIEAGRATDPIHVWKGHGIIIDGMNRFEICTANKLPFDIIEVDLPDRTAVLQWMRRRQLGRRNLTDDQRRYLIGKTYNEQKAEQGGIDGREFQTDRVSV